jgi:rhodanese-related sulfurtransferase
VIKKLTLLSICALFSVVVQADSLHIDGVKTLIDEARLMVNEIEAPELKKLIDSDEDFVLIDIRGEAQKLHGEIYSLETYQIDRGYLEFRVERSVPNKKAKIIVYCCSGQRSLLAVQSLIRMGYKDVHSLKGGLKGWVSSGMILDTVYGEMIMKEADTPVTIEPKTSIKAKESNLPKK